MRRLKMMLTPNEFYTWTWVLQERQKAEAGDKSAFQMNDKELAAAWLAKQKAQKANG